MKRILYSKKVKERIVDSELMRYDVASYQHNYFDQGLIDSSTKENKIRLQKFRFALHAGYGRATREVPIDYVGEVGKYYRILS